MNWRIELSREAEEQLFRFPRNVRERLKHAIDEFEERDESHWSNIKALQGPAWKGRFRKKVGPYRIIFQKFHDQTLIWISAILIRSKDTYRS